jgi:hypothetical protein
MHLGLGLTAANHSSVFFLATLPISPSEHFHPSTHPTPHVAEADTFLRSIPLNPSYELYDPSLGLFMPARTTRTLNSAVIPSHLS